MYQYKILTESYNPQGLEDLEKNINKYAEDGWRVMKIIPHVKGSGNMVYQSFDSDYITLFLEKVVEK